MEWLALAAVVALTGWLLLRTFRTALDVEVNASAIAEAHEAELAARREAVATLAVVVAERRRNIVLWELVAKHCDLLVRTMGMAREFGSAEAMAWLASEMSGETWDQMVELAEKAKR